MQHSISYDITAADQKKIAGVNWRRLRVSHVRDMGSTKKALSVWATS
jgi:hypothetical protein